MRLYKILQKIYKPSWREQRLCKKQLYKTKAAVCSCICSKTFSLNLVSVKMSQQLYQSKDKQPSVNNNQKHNHLVSINTPSKRKVRQNRYNNHHLSNEHAFFSQILSQHIKNLRLRKKIQARVFFHNKILYWVSGTYRVPDGLVCSATPTPVKQINTQSSELSRNVIEEQYNNVTLQRSECSATRSCLVLVCFLPFFNDFPCWSFYLCTVTMHVHNGIPSYPCVVSYSLVVVQQFFSC